MADNIILNAGTGGDTISADDLGTSKVQNVKVGFGVTDTLTKVSSGNPLPVTDSNGSTIGLALEAGHLSTIDAKTPALGQALSGSSVPVVLPAAQITTLTPPAAITGFALEAGHLANIDTSTAKIPAQGQALAGASLPVVLPAAQIITLTPPAAITNYANETGGNLAAIKSKTDNLDVLLSTRTKPADQQHTILDTAIPTGSNIIGKVSIDQTTPGTTNAVQANAGTNLNTSALALETGGNLATIVTNTGKIPSQGQALAAASLPVVLTAAQITTLTPPAAITNFALETGGNLAGLNAKFSALGQQTMANSQSNVFASDFLVTKFTGQSAQTATVNNIIPASSGAAATDVSNFRSFSCQVISTGTGGTYGFEGSNDNVNFQPVATFPQSISPTSQTVYTASASQFIFYGACSFNYLRLRIVSTITGGSIQAFTTLFPWPLSTSVTAVGNGGSGLSIGAIINGQTAHSSAATGTPVRTGGIVVPTTAATQDATLVAGDAANTPITTGYQAINKPFGSSELDWAFNGVITNSTTPAVFKNASGTANIRNYVSAITLNSDTLGAATEVVIKDGLVSAGSQTIASNILTTGTHDFKIGDAVLIAASGVTGLTAGTIYYVLTVPSATTVTFSATPNGSTLTISGTSVTASMNRILFRTKAQTTALAPVQINFTTPLRGAPNATLDITTLTAGVSGNLYYNIAGFTGF